MTDWYVIEDTETGYFFPSRPGRLLKEINFEHQDKEPARLFRTEEKAGKTLEKWIAADPKSRLPKSSNRYRIMPIEVRGQRYPKKKE